MSAVQAAGRASRGTWDKLGFWALIVTQFQGAFNDNAYRWIITYYLFRVYVDPATNLPDPAKATVILFLGAILFAVPFILFPGMAGSFADRHSKRSVAIATKGWEIGVMTLGLVAFELKSEPFMWTMLFMMNMQSAFFSPAKYGILPEMLPEEKLSWGNGILNMATYVAIIAGTAIVGVLFKLELHIYLMSGLLIALSCLGFASSLFITRVPPANPARRITLNPWHGLGRPLGIFFGQRAFLLMLIATGYFWFAGALMQQAIPLYGKSALGLDEIHISALISIVGIGIAIGSLGAGYCARGRIELGLIPFGMTGLGVFAIVLGLSGVGFQGALVLLFLVGFASGFYIVPVYAMIQYRSPRDLKGGMIAALNVTDCCGIFAAGLIFYVGGMLHAGPTAFFVLCGVLTLLVGAILALEAPQIPLRSALWLLTNTLYRVRTKGSENIPEDQAAIFVTRHTSCLDALAIAFASNRRVAFPMADTLFASGLFRLARKPFGLRGGARPDAGETEYAAQEFAAAADALAQGDSVCLFLDGHVTPRGGTIRFEDALAQIRARSDAPVVPVFVDPLQVSLTKIRGGRLRWKKPERIPHHIILSYGPAAGREASAHAIAAAVGEAGVAAYSERHWPDALIHRAFIRTARKHLRLMAAADQRTPYLSYFRALTASIILGKKLRPKLEGQETVGVLLPPTVGGALTNVALQMMGKTVVNLNYSLSAETMASCAQQAGIRTVITAHEFLERFPLKVPGEAVYLDDIMATLRTPDRLAAIGLTLFGSVARIERYVGSPRGRTERDIATIIFSSGSEGEPKGVKLTHANILSNIEGARKVFPHKTGNVMTGILPFFHSFGFTGTLWLPLIEPLGVILYPNPLEAKIIGKMVEQYRAWFLITTCTFLQNFTRRCAPEDLASVGMVVCGAEKLTERVRSAFYERFGVEPLEGYGITECSPIISLELPNIEVPGIRFVAAKHGTVGRPIPGVIVRVEDPDTGEILPPNTPGMLMVRGPNVMAGYLNLPERTAAVLKDGWYRTGDIAAIDEDGFITITDRQARFSKIGGEMVPHIRVEDALHNMLGLTEQALVVIGVPDSTRGERLIVVHTLSPEQIEELLRKLDASDLPNLFRPRPNAFCRVDALPVLGTGKMDIKSVKKIALQFSSGASAD